MQSNLCCSHYKIYARVFHFPTFFDFQVVLLDSGAILGQMNCDFFSEFSETIWRGRPWPFSKMAATQWTICRNCPNWFFFQYGVENLILRNIKMRHFFLKWIFHIFQIFWSSGVGCRERPKIKVFVIFRYFLSFLQISVVDIFWRAYWMQYCVKISAL